MIIKTLRDYCSCSFIRSVSCTTNWADFKLWFYIFLSANKKKTNNNNNNKKAHTEKYTEQSAHIMHLLLVPSVIFISCQSEIVTAAINTTTASYENTFLIRNDVSMLFIYNTFLLKWKCLFVVFFSLWIAKSFDMEQLKRKVISSEPIKKINHFNEIIETGIKQIYFHTYPSIKIKN